MNERGEPLVRVRIIIDYQVDDTIGVIGFAATITVFHDPTSQHRHPFVGELNDTESPLLFHLKEHGGIEIVNGAAG